MAKQLNVSLAFTADTAKAKGQLLDLQKTLQSLVTSINKPSGGLGLSKEIQEATTKAAQLKIQLQDATGSTGKLDLTKFNESMKRSGMSLKQYQTSLSALGPEGDKAFAQLASSIMRAETPLRRSNALLKEFGTTLMNTARWQISSSILHGFMGAVSTAYGYAKDLDKSLNNIRIVTGYSADEMARFATQANKAASALSTTTTAYTDAALIYYQQGIRDDAEIAARTETTIKLANVSRQSAEEVSQQMTAIWNNFEDGTKSLEYYADAITALGASTASSSEEIATGLQKFAAVSKTVGLSYEYATAALATITAQTRQSADTVGTGLRTLFARLESLKLGETLEDDVDLNKYSKALHDVGVEVLDASGEMRQMDSILDDLAARWDQLTQAQQMALAQTVGGVRQYTNLIALMSNWDKMQQNVATAKGSSGTLQQQADIYAESWEAAKKRVKAAAEAIYDALLDEDFFIGFNNAMEGLLKTISGVIDGLGGLPGVLTFLGAIVTQVFDKQIASSIDRMVFNLRMSTEAGREQIKLMQQEATELLIKNSVDSGTRSGVVQGDVYRTQGEAQALLLANAERLSEEETKIAQHIIDQNIALGEQVVSAEAALTAAEKAERTEQKRVDSMFRRQLMSAEDQSKAQELTEEYQKATTALAAAVKQQIRFSSAVQEMSKIPLDINDKQLKSKYDNIFKEIASRVKEAGMSFKEYIGDDGVAAIQKLQQALKSGNFDEIKKAAEDLGLTLDGKVAGKADAMQIRVEQALRAIGIDAKDAADAAQRLADKYRDAGDAAENFSEGQNKLKNNLEQLKTFMDNAKGQTVTFGQSVTSLISGITSLAMGITMIKGLGSIWSNDDLSTGEKILKTITTMGMAIPVLTRGIQQLNTSKLAGLALNGEELKQGVAQVALAQAKAMAKKGETAATIKTNAAKTAELVLEKGGIGARLVALGVISAETFAQKGLAAAVWKVVAAKMALLGPLAAVALAIGALVAIIVAANKAYNADAIEAEKAAKAAKHVGEEADKVKQKAQELHDAFDSYESLVEKLENCTKGTREWREALDEVNSKVLEIMQNHPELIGQMDIVREDGRLILKNYEEILGQMDTAAERLQAATIGANAHASEAQLKSDSTNLYRKFYKYEGDAGNGYVDERAIKANRAVDSIIKNINNYSEALKLGKDNFKESLGDMYSTLNMSDTEFNEFYKSLTELSTKSYQVAVQLDEAAKVAAQIALGDKYSGLGSNVNNAIITETGEEYQQIYDEIYKDVKGLSQKLAQGGHETRPEAAEIWSRYLKAIGENEATSKYKRSDNFIQGNKQNRTYHFIDSKGDEQSLTEKEIADIIAASEAIGKLGDKAEELASNFTKMSGEGREFAASVINSKNAFDEYAAQDALQNMTSSQVAEIASTEDYEGRKNIWEMIGMNEEEFESFAKTLGMTTFELIQFLQKAADDVLDTYINLSEDLSSTPKKYFDATRHHFSELVIAEQKEIVAGYKKVFDAGGEEAVGYFDQMINEATGHEAEMAQILSRMDFSDWDIDKNLKEALQEAGLELPKNFDELVDGLRRATNATKNLDLQNFRTQFGDIQKIVQSLDEWGKTISAEDYEKLGKGYEDYFTLMADGTYKLTGDAKDFYELVQKNQSAELLGKISAVSSNIINDQNSLAMADAAKNSGFDITKSAIDESGEASTAHYNAQLNYLEALGYSKSEIEKWRENTIPTLDVLDKVAKAVRQTSGQYEALSEQIQTNEANQRENIQAYYSMATSLEDLKGRQQDLLDLGIEVNEYEKDFINQKHILGVEQLQTAESLQEVAEIQNKYGLTVDQVKSKVFDLTTSLNLLNEAYEHGYITLEEYENKIKEWIEAAVQNASTLEELNVAVGQFLGVESFDETNNLHYDEYAQGLINLGSKYESCKEAVADYQDALSALNGATGESYEAIKKEIQATEEHLEMNIRAEEACKKYGLTVDTLTAQMKEIAREEGVSEKTALEMAIANERMNRGVAELVNNWEDWKKILKESDKTAEDYAATLDDLSAAVTELVGWYEDLQLDSEFVEQNMNLIDKAAQGDVTSILELGTAVAQLEIASSDLDATLAAGLLADGSENAFQQWANDALTAQQNFENLQNSLGGMFSTIQENMAALQGGASLQDVLGGPGGLDAFIEQLNAYAAATGMTATEMQEMLASVGVTANVQRDFQEQEVTVPAYREEVTAVNIRHLSGKQYTVDGKEVETDIEVPEYTKASVPVEPLKTKGFVEVASISMDKNGEAPHIQPPQFIGKRAPSKTAMSGGTGNKPGSKGSSKSSTPKATKKEVKEHKDLTDEKERYHLINQQIERQTNLLDRLSKNKDRAFGPQKQKWYTQELKSLKDMGKMYEEHLRQSSAYLAQDKATMQAWGAQISAKDGSILNYDALLKAQVDAYNRAIDRYNASGQTDADKDALKAAEDRFKKFQDDLKQYEDTVKTHEEDINKYIDNMIEQYDTMQAKTADAIEFRIEYDDSVLDFLDKLIDRLDSWNGSMFAAVDIMGKLNDKTGALIQKNKDLETATAEALEHFLVDYKEFDAQGNIIYQTGMSKADSDAFINRFNTGGLTSEDIEMLAHMPEEERQLLMDYAEQRQDNTDALIETAQAVVDDVERQFNDAKDELAEAAKPIASATAALDNYAAIIDIVGADYLGVTDDIMQRFRDQQWNVLHETTMSNKAIMESLAAQRDMIEQEMNNALANGNDELAEMYREKLKGINDEVQSATEAWYSSWQAELSKLEEDFEKHIDEIKTKALDLAAGDAGTWQSLKDTMDYAQQAAERFLPEYKEIYEFSKLNRDINKSIDDTDNIKNKQALKKLQDEINKLQEKSGQISQYDLDNARRRYELELARLALEESRNAKEVVRLSKDSEGNWSYIYTASEEDVANAEQNYEDKLFAMQQANADYINDLQGQLTQATEDYYNKVAEINLIYKDDDEKRREELEKARMQYEETMQYYGGELQKAMDNNKQLYDEDWAWYSDYTQKINDDQGYRLGELENYVTEFDDTMLGMATGYDSVVAFEDDLLDHSIDTLGQMDEAYEHWSEQIHFSMEEAGTSVEDFAEDMMEQVDHIIVPKAEEARDSVEDLGETVVDIMAEMVDAASQWRVSYSAAMDAIIAKNDAVKRSIQQVISALSALKTAEIGHDTTTGKAPEGAGKAGPTTSSPTRTSTTPSTGTGSTPGTGTSGSTTPTTKTTKTSPHVVETGYRYQNDETCMGYTKYSDGTETHNAGGHDKKFDHWEDNDAKYICTKCKHMWTVKNARGRGGCFAAGTKIMLPTRELKNIEEIQLGEEILAYNIETESFENKIVNMIYFKRGYNEMADIELSNGEILTMTLGHPLLTTQGWKSLDLENSENEHGVSDATLLSVGDILIGYDRPIIVNNINIYPVDKDYMVYCLGVDGYHNFIANDIIVHNAAYAQITKFATGGYTGDFGNPNEGKLAVLHNKELVLNKDDTEHILNAVDMVRSISKTIDAYAMTNQFTIGNLTAARGINPINGQMEQSVTITAEFPNATDRNEIAEAFNTLINQASQYANRKY